MSSSKHPSNDDEQLAVVRASILDAIRCTIPRADSSSEEQVYVLGMQERFNGLARIIESRIERRALSRDDREWAEKVDGVRSQLEKERAGRGSNVDIGLAASQSPTQELPAHCRHAFRHQLNNATARKLYTCAHEPIAIP
jgi:hypothetical protein